MTTKDVGFHVCLRLSRGTSPSGKAEPQQPPGTKPLSILGEGHWKASWSWHLLSLEHPSPCWAPREVALCSPHPGGAVYRVGCCQGGHPLYAKGSSKPQRRLSGRSWAKGLGRQLVPYKLGVYWGLVLSKVEGAEVGGTLREAGRICAFNRVPQTFMLCLGLPPPPSGSPHLIRQGGPHLHTASVGRERPNVSTWGSAHVLSSYPPPLVAEGESHSEKHRSMPWFHFPLQQPGLLPEDAEGAKPGAAQNQAGPSSQKQQ